MPLLAPRPGEDDGGYAVADYRSVDPRLGTMDDLEALCAAARERGISVCVDLVLNHCAAEHEWAVAARDGDPDAEAMFLTFADRTMPDAYEATLPEVFPDFAPGNFSLVPETGNWVWTTFNSFQWDLNWANPHVFAEMTDVLLNLANKGVEVLRLDAVAFLWKRLGTNCQNQPEVHDLMQALRACARIVAPAVAFKAEAIVSPVELAAYLGVGHHHGTTA
jgi:amylosucrase